MYWNACDKVQTEEHIVEVQRIPLGSSRFRKQVENFLAANGLRMEVFDDYFCVLEDDGSILAGAGLAGDVIKCVAVDASARSEGLVAPLVSHIIAIAAGKGINNLKVFTKPENETIFTSLGFHTIARAPKAVLLENSNGLERYLSSLRLASSGCPAVAGVIIMNANPFTLGHKYLIEKASGQVEKLFVIPVKEDISLFPYEERLEMIRQGCEGLATVLEGSDYQISAATFPTYFLKDLDEASETQMRLDLDLFARHIAPALGIKVRFVGSEPSDPLTARYNELMKEILPTHGISVVEIPRLSLSGYSGGENSSVSLRFAPYPGKCSLEEFPSAAISATDVRKALEQGSFQAAAALTPKTTWPYLVAELMARALRIELDTPMKPGLVDKESNGAHSDMDYALMKGSIDVIRRSFIRHFIGDSATLGTMGRDKMDIVRFGKAIEADVLEYTGGVNTYRGAIFALGLSAIAGLSVMQQVDYQRNKQSAGPEYATVRLSNSLTINGFYTSLRNTISALANEIEPATHSHGASAVRNHGVRGALQMARDGYKSLFEDWLPYYRSMVPAVDAAGLRLYSAAAGRGWTRPGPDAEIDKTVAFQKTLLKIMSTLDDTCVIHRVSYQRAQEVKEEVKSLLEGFNEDGLNEMKTRYDAEGISPGGAADMLALTIFVDSITN